VLLALVNFGGNMLATTNRLQVHLRWMIEKDLDQVLRIEDGNSQLASPVGKWKEQDFLAILGAKDKSNAGIVATDLATHKRVHGFCVYNTQFDKFHAYNIVVDKEYEGQGIGSQIVGKLKGKLGPKRRMLEIDVREYDLRAQLFLKKHDFLAVEIIPGWYEEPRQEDAYRFRFTLE
jgi:ribosomal protein S18 acetylase RimI-like enzyme